MEIRRGSLQKKIIVLCVVVLIIFSIKSYQAQTTVLAEGHSGGLEKERAMNLIKIAIDKTLPKVDSITSSANEAWTKSSVRVSGKVSDSGGAGIFEVRYSNSLMDYTQDRFENSNVHKAEVDKEKFSFNISNQEEYCGYYYVWAYDNAGNKSDIFQKVMVKIDTTYPVLKEISKSPSDTWSEEVVTMNVTAQDVSSVNNSGIAGIRYNTVNDYQTASEILGENEVFELESPVDKVGNVLEFDGTYYVWAFDKVGNVSSVITIPVQIDTKNPVVTGFEIRAKNKPNVTKLVKYLNFGTFCNEEIQVVITAFDEGASAGIFSITLYGDGKEIETKEVYSENKVVFDILFPFNKELSAVITDKVGHISSITLPNQVNPNIKDNKLILEEDPARIKVVPTKDYYTKASDKTMWYSENAEFNIQVEDLKVGIYSVEIKINGKSIIKNLYQQQNKFENFTVSTAKARENRDNSYHFSLEVINNAGTVTNYETIVYKDTTKPKIIKVDFFGKGNKEGSKKLVNATSYGYFFKENTNVTIYAIDPSNSSGVKAITYYTVDYSNSTMGKVSKKKTIVVNRSNQISFTIPANFKGDIYARTTDNVGNVCLDFVKPNRTVIEDKEKHKKTCYILVELPKTSYKDSKGVGLYNADVNANVEVADLYSGIKTVEWTVVSDSDKGNNRKGKINIDNDGVITGDKSGWKITSKDNNLVTSVTKVIKVKNNSNNIRVQVKLTDRAGNISKKDIVCSIDKTVPKIRVKYNNYAYDAGLAYEQEYYKQNRTVTITVTERNFKKENVKIITTNSGGIAPKTGEWLFLENSINPNYSTYSTTLVYAVDGDYTFDIGVRDLAGNNASKFKLQRFTIDKTVPTISVSYNNIRRNNYYKETRTAQISIREHNFHTGRIKITGTAKDGDRTIDYPLISDWSTCGDIHTATIQYTKGGLYTFDINYSDKAGNVGDDFLPQCFYIDKTAPLLKITGVSDKSANNGKVIPIITFSDSNFNKENITISLTGSNRGSVELDGTFKPIKNGQVFIFENFPEIKKMDDVYRLTAAVKDMAGNETKESIQFSINRFGSFYIFGDNLKAMKGSYIQEVKDIVISEVNVDSLEKSAIRVKVVKDGTPIDLIEGLDYKFEKKDGDRQWNRYDYTIFAKTFFADGVYMVTLYSVDDAGNINENIDQSKAAELWFGIDKTPPVIISIDMENGKTYVEDSKSVKLSVRDNLILKSVKIYLNDEEVKYTIKGEEYIFFIDSSNICQSIKIVCTDEAGNKYEREIDNFYVTTNLFVRWYTNTMLFVGTIIGVMLLALGILLFVVLRKKGKPKFSML